MAEHQGKQYVQRGGVRTMNATVKRIVELLFQDVEMTDEVNALE